MSFSFRPTTALPIAAVAISVVVGACGAPQAQEIHGSADGAHFAVPKDWVEVDRQIDGVFETALYGPAGSTPDGDPLGPDPIVTIISGSRSDAVTFEALRSVLTDGLFDPLIDETPDDFELTLTSYSEIIEPDAWGIRIAGVRDQFRAIDLIGIVDRQTEIVSFSTITCSEACYVEHLDQINEIQDSWTLEPRS